MTADISLTSTEEFELSVLKQKSLSSSLSEAQNQMQSSNKFELSKYIGMTARCPKLVQLIDNRLVESPDGCVFEIQNLQNLAAMNGHLKKHTQTFKCGHCGKTHTNASDFHQHTAMSHGNKIPDLVKDPEAAANFQALKVSRCLTFVKVQGCLKP